MLRANTFETLLSFLLNSKDPIWTWHDTTQLMRLPVSTIAALAIPEAKWRSVSRRVVQSGLVGRVSIHSEFAYLRQFFSKAEKSDFDIAGIASEAVAQQRILQLITIKALFNRWNPDVALTGNEYLDKPQDSGQGVIIWQAPFVYATLAAKLTFNRHGYALHHLSRYLHPYTNSYLGVRLLNPIRCIPENRYLKERIVIERGGSPRRAMIRMTELLKSGGVVSISIGANAKSVHQYPFLGGAVTLPDGPLRLADNCNAVILPAFTVWDGRRFATTIEPPVATLKQAAASIQAWARRFPEQLMWRDSLFTPNHQPTCNSMPRS